VCKTKTQDSEAKKTKKSKTSSVKYQLRLLVKSNKLKILELSI